MGVKKRGRPKKIKGINTPDEEIKSLDEATNGGEVLDNELGITKKSWSYARLCKPEHVQLICKLLGEGSNTHIEIADIVNRVFSKGKNKTCITKSAVDYYSVGVKYQPMINDYREASKLTWEKNKYSDLGFSCKILKDTIDSLNGSTSLADIKVRNETLKLYKELSGQITQKVENQNKVTFEAETANIVKKVLAKEATWLQEYNPEDEKE